MRAPTLVITDASFAGADATPVRYEGTRFEAVRFIGVRSMRGRISFEDCRFVDCEFVDCDVDATFCGALAHPESASTFERTRFDRCRMADAYLGGATLQDCAFTDCDFDGTRWEAVDLIGCVFRGIVEGMTLSARSGPVLRPPPNHREKLPPRANRITDNDFSRADLRGIALRRGVVISAQRWPDTAEYVVLDRIPERVGLAAAALGDAADHESNVMARLLANEARTGQHTDIYRYDDPSMPPVQQRMVRMLADVVLPETE